MHLWDRGPRARPRPSSRLRALHITAQRLARAALPLIRSRAEVLAEIRRRLDVAPGTGPPTAVDGLPIRVYQNRHGAGRRRTPCFPGTARVDPGDTLFVTQRAPYRGDITRDGRSSPRGGVFPWETTPGTAGHHLRRSTGHQPSRSGLSIPSRFVHPIPR